VVRARYRAVIVLFLIVVSNGRQRKLHKPPYLGVRQKDPLDHRSFRAETSARSYCESERSRLVVGRRAPTTATRESSGCPERRKESGICTVTPSFNSINLLQNTLRQSLSVEVGSGAPSARDLVRSERHNRRIKSFAWQSRLRPYLCVVTFLAISFGPFHGSNLPWQLQE